MRFIIAILLCLLPATVFAQTGSVKTQSQLNTEIGTTGCSQPTCLYPDNTQGLITPFDVRQGLLDVVATLFTTGIVDPRSFGLVGDGVTDNTTAFNTLEGTSNINIKWPSGVFCVNGGGMVSGNFVRNTGVSNQVTVIKNCGASNNTTITVTGGFAVFEHMQILGLNNISSTNPAIYLNGSTHCILFDVTVYYGFYGIKNNSADCHMIDVNAAFSFQANFYSNNGAFYILRNSFDNPQPYGTIPSSTAAWSMSTPVATNAVLTVSGTPLQYSGSCTTGGSAPTVVGYGLNITDGTCTAQIAGPLYLSYFDSGASVNFVDASDFSGFYLNAAIYSVSSSLSIRDSVISGYGYGVELAGGDQVTLDNVSISFSQSGANGLLATAAFSGDLSMTNAMINNSPGTGVFLQGGTTATLANNRTSNLSNGGYGLDAAGANHVLSTNNNWGGTTGNPGGITVASTSDYFRSVNDDLTNAGTKITKTTSGTNILICFTAGVSNICNTLPSGSVWPINQGGTGISSGAAFIMGPATNVNFSSAGDNNLSTPLPSGFTRLCGLQFVISGASGNITGATFQIWTAAGGTGIAVTASQSSIVATSSENTANNAQVLNSTNINSGSYLPTANNLFFRVGTTAAQTANVQAGYRPCP